VDVRAQWTAARRSAAVADLSARRARLLVTGRDRRRFLHGLTSNDVAALEHGGRCLATLLNPQGKLLAAFEVYDRGDDFLLECAASAGDRLLALLDRYVIADDVKLARAAAAALPAWAAFGPDAAAIVGEALGGGAPAAPPAEESWLAAGEGALVASARADLGAPGFLVIGAPLPAGPAAAAAPRLDDETLELLRIEGGVAAPGHEIDEKLLPQEAALDRALSFSKGCYVGQEAVAMLHYRGKLRRKLLGLVLAAGGAAAPGDAVMKGDEEVGRVTSGALVSPAFEAPVALGVLKIHEPGAAVEIAGAGGRVAATVHALPLVA
jgi:folate-binding protein YgfZ